MIKNISKKLTDQLLRQGVIEKDSYEIYEYGMEQFFTKVLNMVILIVLALVFNQLWSGITFAIAFMSLRKYAGGYHASTPLRCFLLTSGVIATALSVMRYIKFDIFVCALLLALSSGIILLLSPVESENKPLDSIEKMIYRRKALVIWGVEVLCFLLLQVIGERNLSLGIVWAQVTIGLALVVGKIQIEREKEK